jgi:hypothetical protein
MTFGRGFSSRRHGKSGGVSFREEALAMDKSDHLCGYTVDNGVKADVPIRLRMDSLLGKANSYFAYAACYPSRNVSMGNSSALKAIRARLEE